LPLSVLLLQSGTDYLRALRGLSACDSSRSHERGIGEQKN
jgi:hypothetical protein